VRLFHPNQRQLDRKHCRVYGAVSYSDCIFFPNLEHECLPWLRLLPKQCLIASGLDGLVSRRLQPAFDQGRIASERKGLSG
jgi:hypothetical protein